ncbi:MAG TPA: zinc ribbon domain-containing protein [Cellvibrionaceae bacterium]
MPVYEYKCAQHGLFFELATMDEAHKPCACPTCSAMAPRVIMINPAFLDMPQSIKQAHAVNEKAQHVPEHSTKARREDDHQHKKGCGCQNKKSRTLLYTAQGEKMFPSARPWMISH